MDSRSFFILAGLIGAGAMIPDAQYEEAGGKLVDDAWGAEIIVKVAPPSAAELGNVIFVICEFQIVDRDTEAHNELGEASHAKYKERQKKAVMRRLQLGGAGDSVTRIPTATDVRKKK